MKMGRKDIKNLNRWPRDLSYKFETYALQDSRPATNKTPESKETGNVFLGIIWVILFLIFNPLVWVFAGIPGLCLVGIFLGKDAVMVILMIFMILLIGLFVFSIFVDIFKVFDEP